MSLCLVQGAEQARCLLYGHALSRTRAATVVNRFINLHILSCQTRLELLCSSPRACLERKPLNCIIILFHDTPVLMKTRFVMHLAGEGLNVAILRLICGAFDVACSSSRRSATASCAVNPSAWSDGHCPHTVNITCRGVTGTARMQ